MKAAEAQAAGMAREQAIQKNEEECAMQLSLSQEPPQGVGEREVYGPRISFESPAYTEQALDAIWQTEYDRNISRLGLTEEEAREWADDAVQSIRETQEDFTFLFSKA